MTTHGIRNLFNRLDIITWNELIVRVKEFNATLLEGSLSQEEAFDPR